MTENEKLILNGLIQCEDYRQTVLPHLKNDYFEGRAAKLMFTLVNGYIDKYSSIPTKQSMIVILDDLDMDQETLKDCQHINDDIFDNPCNNSTQWMIDTTEEYCRNRAMFNALQDSIEIVGDDSPNAPPMHKIRDLMVDALAVGFDTKIGHEYLEDYDLRFDSMHSDTAHIGFDIDMFNKITNGGVCAKTLNLLLASTGVGKSLIMCHMASNNLIDGKNVLYITLELSEEKVSERIDTNILDIEFDDLHALSRDMYKKKIEKVQKKTKGKLFVKEYPTSSAHIGHFKVLLKELKSKKDFVPDIIYIDYLSICASSRVALSAGMYSYIKAIAEELRQLAVEYDVPIISAVQTNRGGINNTDVDLSNTSECLSPDTEVIRDSGDVVELKTLKVGDKILGSHGNVDVLKVFPITQKKKMYKITTKSGKTIICSKDHVFPTENGRISIKTGLKVGSKLCKLL